VLVKIYKKKSEVMVSRYTRSCAWHNCHKCKLRPQGLVICMSPLDRSVCLLETGVGRNGNVPRSLKRGSICEQLGA